MVCPHCSGKGKRFFLLTCPRCRGIGTILDLSPAGRMAAWLSIREVPNQRGSVEIASDAGGDDGSDGGSG